MYPDNSSDREEQIDEAFTHALSLPEVERQYYLAELSSSVEADVRELLSATRRVGDEFLNPLLPAATPLDDPGQADFPDVDGYEIIDRIGHGGMGIVYEAQQLSADRRLVALKVINDALSGSEAVKRFRTEQASVLKMDHPAIARVIETGLTRDNRPFMAMELVRGETITIFCDRRRFSLKKRLQLFVQICQAVQHAHQKRIIHRDLKPSNVLATELNQQPQVKVIDFGLAKQLVSTAELGDKSQITEVGQVVGTLRYMSPEQTLGSDHEVDTLTDVYSLGVILYELLTGSTPIDRETAGRLPPDEVLRQIRQMDPPRPSQRAGEGGQRAEVAAARCGLTAKALSSELRLSRRKAA